jgi:O-antigen/teichoic acid export membrane protein
MATAPWMRSSALRTPSTGGSGRVLGHASIYIGGTMVQQALGILLLPVVTRVLGVHEFGIVGTAAALSSLLVVLYGLGLNFAIVRFYYDEGGDAPRAGWAALVHAQGIAALVLAVITFLTGPWWSSALHGFGWAPAFKIAVGLAWLGAMQGTAQGVLRAMRRPYAYVTVSLLQVAIGVPLAISFAARWGAVGYMAGLAAGSGAALIVSLALTYRPARWSRSVLTAGIALSLPAMVHQVSTWGIDLADRLLVAGYLGAREVGRYQLAYVLGSGLVMALTGLQSAWAPHFMSLGAEVRRRAPALLILPMTVAAGVGVSLLVIAAPGLLAILAPHGFGGTELVVALVAASILPRATYFMAVVVLVDQRRSRTMGTASIGGFALNVGLNVALIPRYGLVAAAAATAAAFAAQTVPVLLQAQKLLGQRLHVVRICLVWLLGTAVLVLVAKIPMSTAGYALRGALVIPAVLIGVTAIRRLRGTYTSTFVPQPSHEPFTVAP